MCFCSSPQNMELVELIGEHQKSKKDFAVQDAYKLIYQCVFGVAHILDNQEMAKKYLESEIESIIASDKIDLIENISLSGEIVRLNLQPYKFQSGDTELLFQAMLRSAQEICGSQKEFLKLWNVFKQAVLDNKLNFSLEELKKFDTKVKSQNYPAMHHSENYRVANKPAYRVLRKEDAIDLIKNQNLKFCDPSCSLRLCGSSFFALFR